MLPPTSYLNKCLFTTHIVLRVACIYMYITLLALPGRKLQRKVFRDKVKYLFDLRI